MRRGINIRKKKRIILRKTNKQAINIMLILLAIIISCIMIYFFFLQDIFVNRSLEKDSMSFAKLNESIPFSLRKMILFSSATAESGSINQLLSLDISQYCDIGIYLDKINDENISINSLYIDNIIVQSPKIGTPYLYKKSVSDLGKCSFDEKNIIDNIFYFNVIDKEAQINYNNYEIYSNASTPFSLGFYNKDVKTNFITDTSEIFYNGLLLREAFIPIANLNCNISFRINIITNSDEHYICNINFDIPLESDTESLYDTGYITKEFKTNELNKFIRLK